MRNLNLIHLSFFCLSSRLKIYMSNGQCEREELLLWTLPAFPHSRGGFWGGQPERAGIPGPSSSWPPHRPPPFSRFPPLPYSLWHQQTFLNSVYVYVTQSPCGFFFWRELKSLVTLHTHHSQAQLVFKGRITVLNNHIYVYTEKRHSNGHMTT